jgi:hypothetical protein
MSNQEILKSKKFKIAAIVIGVFILIVVSFGAGIGVGLHKARFSYKFGENYERNFIGKPFDGPRGILKPGPRGTIPDFEGRGFRNPHGVAGEIISVADNKIIIKDRDGQENTISVNDKTLIKRQQDTISINDLKNDDEIVVMGRPNDDGMISADLIRVFPN